jgi:hypothetical protein
MLNRDGSMGKGNKESIRGSYWPTRLLNCACRHFKVIKFTRNRRRALAR